MTNMLTLYPTHHSKQHPDPVSCFATMHFPDRQTDRLTHGISDRSIPRALTLNRVAHLK